MEKPDCMEPHPAIGGGKDRSRPPRGDAWRMVIAGGGTGGHLFPGVAIAEEFLRRNPAHRLLFIGTERGLEKKVLHGLGHPLRTIPVEGIKGRGMLKSAAALAKIPRSLRISYRILRDFKPDIVVGVGGYASGPAVLAAWLSGTRTVVAEQNAFPGLTNRILGRIVDRIFLTFAESQRWFPNGRTLVTGNPIRAAFFQGGPEREAARPIFTILVFGGSQGAQGVNRMLREALEHLQHLKSRLAFIHQTGEGGREGMAKAYREKGFTAEVVPFITDMAAAYRRADLLICRAGATTIAEITAGGKASVLIPYPYAVNDHQSKNAEVLSRAGAAEVIAERELSGARLASLIDRMQGNPDALRKMAEAASRLGNPEAAKTIVDACLLLLGRRCGTDNRKGEA